MTEVTEEPTEVKHEPTKEERYQRWLGFWKQAAALPCSARVQKSVERSHQQRGNKMTLPPRPITRPPAKPAAVIKKLLKHRRNQRPSPVPGFVQARSLVPFQKTKAIGRMAQSNWPRASETEQHADIMGRPAWQWNWKLAA